MLCFMAARFTVALNSPFAPSRKVFARRLGQLFAAPSSVLARCRANCSLTSPMPTRLRRSNLSPIRQSKPMPLHAPSHSPSSNLPMLCQRAHRAANSANALTRSGADFGRLKEFDVLAAQPVPKSLLKGARCVCHLMALGKPSCGLRET